MQTLIHGKDCYIVIVIYLPLLVQVFTIQLKNNLSKFLAEGFYVHCYIPYKRLLETKRVVQLIRGDQGHCDKQMIANQYQKIAPHIDSRSWH